LIDREDRNQYMSQAQCSWVYKIAEDVLQLKEPKPEVRSIDASNILASLAEAREIAQAEGVRLAGLWNQRISYLADIGSIAPMLGLFGTVLGMIKSFSVVASDIAASRPMMLADGVAEALVTTAVGLMIGIPVMAAYAFFRGRVQSMVSDLEAASTILMAQLGAGHSDSSKY
jgi:biopolymer transport protein ExbB